MTISPVAADGKPAQLDAPPVLSSSDTSVVSITPVVGGYYVIAEGAGSASILVSATSFGTDVSEQIDVVISDATAVSLGITFSAPIPK